MKKKSQARIPFITKFLSNLLNYGPLMMSQKETHDLCTTVRPRNIWPQAAWTLTMHVFE